MTIVVNPAVMIVAMIVMPGRTALRVTIATAMTGTVTIVTRMIAADTAGNALGRLLAVVKSMIVGPPGLHLRGGMMIEGLQGTMIGEVAMMTEEALILTMTVAGMITTDAGTTVAGTNGTIVSRTGRGTPTGITDGLAED